MDTTFPNNTKAIVDRLSKEAAEAKDKQVRLALLEHVPQSIIDECISKKSKDPLDKIGIRVEMRLESVDYNFAMNETLIIFKNGVKVSEVEIRGLHAQG
jgi:hypothetical protein